jgi:hypothetical protein
MEEGIMYLARKIFSRPLKGVLMAAALLPGAGCHASTVISELFYDAAGADNGLVFVELFGTTGTLLDGMLLEGVNGGDGTVYRSISLSGEIPADGIFVIADDRGDGTSLVADFDLVAEVDFQNGPDSIVLRNAAGVLDALGYGDFTASVFAGEGDAAIDVNAGRSLVRLDPLVDSNNNAADFSVLGTPTPGSIPVAAVPVPPALVLFMSGMAGLLGIGRRKPVNFV